MILRLTSIELERIFKAEGIIREDQKIVYVRGDISGRTPNSMLKIITEKANTKTNGGL